MNAPISLRAYAEHRKVSVMAVSRAVKSGRLSRSVTRDGHGQPKIADVELADQEWAAHTDLSRAPGYVKELADGRVQTSAQAPATGDPAAAADDSPVGRSAPSLTEASAEEKRWKARLARVQYEERIGQLVNKRAVLERQAAIFTEVRTKLLMIPSKAKFAIPTLTHADTAKLDQLIRDALEALTLDDGAPVVPSTDAGAAPAESMAV